MTQLQRPHPASEPPSAERPAGERHDQAADRTRAGAVWVTGTGAFLLLAAAAVFIAVRWADIPSAAKLATIGALTGGFLLGGRRLRTSLPATGSALFHLGAFLVPVDVAALAVRADAGWEVLLLVEGLVCGLTFTLTARSEGSIVLRWAAAASAVVVAAGLGAVGPVPAPVVVALAAVLALAAGSERLAVAWAGIAGLAPLVGLALDATRIAPGTLERLGLAGEQPRLSAALTGLASAWVLAVVARRRLEPGLALLAATCALIGVGLTGGELDPSPWAWVIGCCGLLATVELGALLLRHDPFWGRPLDVVAIVAEILAVPGTIAAAGVLALSPFLVLASPDAAAATGLLALTWLVADLRRRVGAGTPVALSLLFGGRFAPATIGLVACTPAAVTLATGSGPLTAVALVVTSAALAAGGRPLAAGAAVTATVVAPASVLGHRAVDLFTSQPVPDPSTAVLLTVAAVGVAGSLLLARLVTWQPVTDASTDRATAATFLLASSVPLPVFVASGVLGGAIGARGALLACTVGLTWIVSAATDARPRPRRHLTPSPSTATRAVSLGLVLASCGELDPVEVVVVVSFASLLVVVDALRLDEPRLAFGLVPTLPVAAVAAGAAAALPGARSGVALTLAAVVVAGLASLAPPRWRSPLSASTAALALAGLALAAGEPTALADALVVTGGLLVAAGLGSDRLVVAVAGGGSISLGAWARLVDAGIDASEPYVAPVAALLLLVGLRGGDDRASSWVTTGPAVLLLGGSAVVERLSGGGGGHALVAGAVAVVAVAAGGRWRLGAPLVLGTGLLVVLVAHESLAVTAGVPTWGWLALGGTTLLGVGTLLERGATGPVETGRRLVDVIQQGYR